MLLHLLQPANVSAAIQSTKQSASYVPVNVALLLLAAVRLPAKFSIKPACTEAGVQFYAFR